MWAFTRSRCKKGSTQDTNKANSSQSTEIQSQKWDQFLYKISSIKRRQKILQEEPLVCEVNLIQFSDTKQKYMHTKEHVRALHSSYNDMQNCFSHQDHTAKIAKLFKIVKSLSAALVAQAVSRRPAEREVSGSIPDASRPSVCRPRLRPPGAGTGSRAAVAWRRRRSLPVNG